MELSEKEFDELYDSFGKRWPADSVQLGRNQHLFAGGIDLEDTATFIWEIE